MAVLLDYTFDDISVANPDGSHPLRIAGGEVVDGPGALGDGEYPAAVDLGEATGSSVDASELDLDARRFRVQVVFRLPAEAFDGRQNLVESDRLPVALFLAGRPDGARVVASVRPTAHGWRGVDTRFGPDLDPGTWHVADVVYDLDTVALFVDGAIVAVRAFPHGAIDLLDGTKVHVGAWVDGRRHPFTGALAALRLDADIPADVEGTLDERRRSAEWFITRKVEEVRPTVNLGEPLQPAAFRGATGAWLQTFDNGAVMCNLAAGAAFEMHGSIHARYTAMRNRDQLGALVSDELVAADPTGRQSVFTRGAIYWSPSSGAHPVLGDVYLHYEDLGATRAWGFPTAAATAIAGGTDQVFQRARFYHRPGDPSAHEVHGSILARYLSAGGVTAWGFPVSDEGVLRGRRGEVGRFSEFERAAVHWSPGTGAHLVHGTIRRRYDELGGPLGPLGLPTSAEVPIPGVAGAAMMQGFQNASIASYGSLDATQAIGPFRLFLQSLNTDESEGFGRGQNDLYVRVTIRQGGTILHRRKYPSSGDWGGRNVRDVNVQLPTTLRPGPGVTFTLSVDVWESDSGGPFSNDDDHLGEWTVRLDGANGWGLRTNSGILESGSFRKVNNIRVSVQPSWQDPRLLTEQEKFWGVANASTEELSRSTYANAFRDVDSDTEWWDVEDWLHKAFYELVVQGIASDGNCFGLCLEAIYARKAASAFSLPLSRFTSFSTIEPVVNVKHAYQVGAAPIWWFVGQFLTGNTHDPKDVFRRTREAAGIGQHPVLCIAQNDDFGGEPHCILPVAWKSSATAWTMTVLDPNFTNGPRTLTVDPRNNTFRYQGSHLYEGGEWSGGRMHFMPFGVLDRAPRTPVWDAIMLLLTGTVVIVASDAETESLADADGRNLDATSPAAKRALQAGGRLDGHFLRVPGFDGSRVLDNEVLFAMGDPTRRAGAGPATVDPGTVVNVEVGGLRANRDLRRVRDLVTSGTRDDAGRSGLGGRTLSSVLADRGIVLTDDVREQLQEVLGQRRPGDVVHKVTGVRKGRLDYVLKHALAAFRVEGPTATGERTTVRAKDLGTSDALFAVRNSKARTVDVRADQRLGIKGNAAQLRIEGVTTAARRDVELHTGPGLGTVDLAVPGDQAVVVRVGREVDGQVRERTFRVQPNGISRLTMTQALDEGVVGVSRIERPHGPVLETEIVDADR